MHELGSRTDLSVAVVVPTFGRPALLKRALDSVSAQEPAAAEVLVIDVDGRSGASAGHGRSVGRVVVPGPCSSGRARNVGVASTTAPVVAFLDDDDIWEPGYLAQAVGELARGASAVVTPLVVRAGSRRRVLPRPRLDLPASKHLARNPGVTGSNLVLRRDAFSAVGGYDEGLRAYNDLDLLVRLLDAGIEPVVAPQPLAEQLLHDGTHATNPSAERLAALRAYLDKHGGRMSPAQRIRLEREAWWMLARVTPRMRSRLAFRALQLALTPPHELLRAYRHRSALGGARE